MKRLRDLTAVLGMVALAACNNASIEGSWVEPVPGMPGMQQGFVLDRDGSASSINMATLKYEAWKKVGNRLLLSGTSIGNHQNISFTDTLTIEKLTQDSLILKRGELLLKYARNNEALNQKTIPAAVLTPAKKLLSVRGEVIRVRIDKELKERFREICDNKNITMSKFIINVIILLEKKTI